MIERIMALLLEADDRQLELIYLFTKRLIRKKTD